MIGVAGVNLFSDDPSRLGLGSRLLLGEELPQAYGVICDASISHLSDDFLVSFPLSMLVIFCGT